MFGVVGVFVVTVVVGGGSGVDITVSIRVVNFFKVSTL